MSTITALASNGVDLVYIEGVGSGTTQQDPFKPKHVVDGVISISANQLPLPTGAASDVKIQELVNKVVEIDAALGQVLTVNTGLNPLTDLQLRATPLNVTLSNTSFPATQSGTWTVAVSNLPVTQPVSASSLPLPTGAATEQTLGAINDKLPTLSAGRLPVDIGGNGSITITSGTVTVNNAVEITNDSGNPIPVNGTVTANQGGTWNVNPIAVPSVTLVAESGYLTYRNTALSNTAVSIKASAGSLMGWNVINPNTVPVYIKFYNVVAGSVTVGTTPVSLTLLIPPGDSTSPSMFFLEPSLVPVEIFSTAISAAAVTGLADNSFTAPTVPIHFSARYK